MDATRELLSIGEAAALLDVSPQTLRRWEAQGHISPVRTPGGQRRYERHEVEALLTRATPGQAS